MCDVRSTGPLYAKHCLVFHPLVILLPYDILVNLVLPMTVQNVGRRPGDLCLVLDRQQICAAFCGCSVPGLCVRTTACSPFSDPQRFFAACRRRCLWEQTTSCAAGARLNTEANTLSTQIYRRITALLCVYERGGSAGADAQTKKKFLKNRKFSGSRAEGGLHKLRSVRSLTVWSSG